MPRRSKKPIRSAAPVVEYSFKPKRTTVLTRRGLDNEELVYVRDDFGFYEELLENGRKKRHLIHIPSGRSWWTTGNLNKAKKAVREAAMRITKPYRNATKQERSSGDLKDMYGKEDAQALVYGTLYSAYKAGLMDKAELDNKLAALNIKNQKMTKGMSGKKSSLRKSFEQQSLF